jgi:hypothetical protein
MTRSRSAQSDQSGMVSSPKRIDRPLRPCESLESAAVHPDDVELGVALGRGHREQDPRPSGVAALAPQSGRPLTSPVQTSAELEAEDRAAVRRPIRGGVLALSTLMCAGPGAARTSHLDDSPCPTTEFTRHAVTATPTSASFGGGSIDRAVFESLGA